MAQTELSGFRHPMTETVRDSSDRASYGHAVPPCMRILWFAFVKPD